MRLRQERDKVEVLATNHLIFPYYIMHGLGLGRRNISRVRYQKTSPPLSTES